MRSRALGFFALAFALVGFGASIASLFDYLAPAHGLTQPDYDQLVDDFDTLMYAVDTTAFGRESDIDGNGVVVVLLTQHVNALSPDCNNTGRVILGYFFGADLMVKGAYTQSRLRQMIFGGATRQIINEAKIPVLMAH